MLTRGKAALVQMPGLGGMLGLGDMLGADKQEGALPNGFTGKEYSKRKARSKIAKASKKRNRKG